MRIEDIMTKSVWSVAPDVSAEVAWQQMRKRRVRHLVVMKSTRVVGIIPSATSVAREASVSARIDASLS
ncbi:hypothetical protein BH11MYX2_BH11MYX2_11160 [soil metagenome]